MCNYKLNDSGLEYGDCGALVVDQETLDIYGHVIGSDSFGSACVVPLAHTMRQLKSAFDVSDVKLPTAEDLDLMGQTKSPSASSKVPPKSSMIELKSSISLHNCEGQLKRQRSKRRFEVRTFEGQQVLRRTEMRMEKTQTIMGIEHKRSQG